MYVFRMLRLMACTLAGVLLLAGPSFGTEDADGALRVELVTAYNLVVDSNILSPSSYSPESAYLGAIYHNDGATTISNVFAYIGAFNGGGGAETPGIYPVRVDPLIGSTQYLGNYSLTHEGGSLGTVDATRFLGNIEPGESIAVYWLISYPLTATDATGTIPSWGNSVKPDDDLSLNFDVWGTAVEGGVTRQVDVTRTLTMRNEISAAANKILPNTSNKVPQEWKDSLMLYDPAWTSTDDDGTPGTAIVTEGIWYDFGNVGHGFDNNGDLIPDKNAWMQPVGDPTTFDPSLFRLVETRAFVLVQLKDGGEQVFEATNKLYFENIPENVNAVGYVAYNFMPLQGPGAALLSPYQEVASGFDNEKFNGDFGAALGNPLVSKETNLTLDKQVNLSLADPGDLLDYTIDYTNPGQVAVGDPSVGAPLTVTDTIPEGTTYVAGSAVVSNTLPAGVAAYTVLYSTDDRATWNPVEPVPATDVTDIRWWLSDEMPTGTVGQVTFQVTIVNPPLPIVDNVAELGFGNGSPVLEDDARTLLRGPNSLGDTVWFDTGSGTEFANGFEDASETTGVENMSIALYYDLNTNGVVDVSDLLVSNAVSAASTGFYLFSELPDGSYVVELDLGDPDLPFGHTITTPGFYAVDLDSAGAVTGGVSSLINDFGLAPVLTLDKELVDPSPVSEGQQISYTIDVVNHLPGDGTGVGSFAEYQVYSSDFNLPLMPAPANKRWGDFANVSGAPDGLDAVAPFDNAGEKIAVTDFDIAVQPGNVTGVELVLPVDILVPIENASTMIIEVFETGNGTPVYTTNFVVNVEWTADGEYTYDLTAAKAWDWASFGTNVTVLLTASKAGGENGSLGLDAVCLNITTDNLIGVADDNTTLRPVPLEDTFDTTQLEFVESFPANDGYSVVGTDGSITWDDIGPILPGGTSTVTVVFNVLEPAGFIDDIITNIAFTVDPLYENGLPANNATDVVETVVLQTALIGDFVWRDLNQDGIQDGGAETGIGGVTVQLTPPGGVDLGAGAGVPVTTVTDADGLYQFIVPTNATYTVDVLTGTLPGGSFTNTYDEDSGIISPDNSTVVTIAGMMDHLTADFGYLLPTIIDGHVWHDLDFSANDTRDPGEPWLEGVSVYLIQGGTTNAITTTDANGYFQFTGSFVGTYDVVVDDGTGPLGVGTWSQTFDTDGLGSPHAAEVTVVLGGSAHTDYSYIQSGPYDIGDTVFYDWNGNAIQDVPADEGIPGVPLSLYLDVNTNGVYDVGVDGFITNTVTDIDGMYLFPNRPDGNYVVVVDESVLPTTYVQTLDPDEVGVAVIADGQGAAVVAGADNLDIDFAYTSDGLGSIGDTVWRDLDGDQIQLGVLETGIPDITVTLFADLNNDTVYVAVSNLSTDVNGEYLFTGLPDGNYRVIVNDSDPDLPLDTFGNEWLPTTPTMVDTTIATNSFLDADFGFAPLGAIGDTVYWDANRNGTQDFGESGIPGVTLSLYIDVNTNDVFDVGDTFITNAVTDVDGYYIFTGLPAENYIVRVDTNSAPIVGVTLTADPDADGDPATDYPKGTAPNDDETDVTLFTGSSFFGADFGYAPPGVIGDTVWIDVNENGMLDGGEQGIPFIDVILFSGGFPIATNVTDSDGMYLFDNLLDGTYQVVVDVSDSDWPSPSLVQVYDPDGISDDTGSDVILSGGDVTSIGGAPCTNCFLDVDFGYNLVGTNIISGTVGLDDPTEDGLLNGTIATETAANESPFANVEVFLALWTDLDSSGDFNDPGEADPYTSTFTDAEGDYSFSNLPGLPDYDGYIVSIAAPATGLIFTTDPGEPGTPVTSLEVVAANNLSGENVSAYQVVEVDETTENIDFAYRTILAYDFGDLPNSYSVQVGDVPTGARHVVTNSLYLGATPPDSEPDGQPSVDATGDGADEDGLTWVDNWIYGTDGGSVIVEVGSGSGYLVGWVDFDQSGDFTGLGEMIIDGPVSSTGGPNSDGIYLFTFDLPGGTLSTNAVTTFNTRLRLFPAGEVPLFPAAAFTGDAGGGEVEDHQILMPPPSTLAGTVFYDLDGDGNAEPEDTNGIAGVSIKLLDTNGVVVATTETDALGDYLFTNLVADTYVVMETDAPDYVSTLDIDGPNDNMITAVVPVATNVIDQDFYDTLNLVALGNSLWEDNGSGLGVAFDGMRNGTEPGFANVLVELYANGDDPAVDAAITSVVSNANGYYYFDRIPPGDYFVHVPPSNFAVGGELAGMLSAPGNGANETDDSDVDENGIDAAVPALTGVSSTVFSLAVGVEPVGETGHGIYEGTLPDANVNLTADLAFAAPSQDDLVALGGAIWLDEGAGALTNDGIYDGTESFVSGVPVQLFTSSQDPLTDTPLAQTVSAVDGSYFFDELPAGDYFAYIPGSAFGAGGALSGKISSTGTSLTNDDYLVDENGNDAANLPVNGIQTGVFTLSANTAPTGEPVQASYTGNLDDNNVNATVDFGFYGPADLVTIGGHVWADIGTGLGIENNGILDGSEMGIGSVTVELYAVGMDPATDAALATTTTAGAGTGFYEFPNLVEGNYFVYLPPSNFQSGGTLEGSASSTGNGVSESDDYLVDENGIDVAQPMADGIASTPFDLTVGGEVAGEPGQANSGGAQPDNSANLTADFGITQPAPVALGGVIWLDDGAGGGLIGNGILDGTETGIPGVSVELFAVGDDPATDAPLASVVSGASGEYVFDTLIPGDYFVHVPANQFIVGGALNNTVSSTGNGSDEVSGNDVDENGIDQPTPFATGISTTSFALESGLEVSGEIGQGLYTGALADNSVNMTDDMGFVPVTVLVSLGGTVFLDTGDGGGQIGDGTQDGTEAGIPAVDVAIYAVGATPGVDAPVATTTTDGAGYYNFDNLVPGEYFVFIPPSEFSGGQPLNGTLSSLGSGANTTVDQNGDENGIDDPNAAVNGLRSNSFTLLAGGAPLNELEQPSYVGVLADNSVNLTADFGFFPPLTVGNIVWHDIDNNGLLDGGELGIDGVVMHLYTSAQTPGVSQPILVTETSGGGSYEFTGLPPGDYVIFFPRPPAAYKTSSYTTNTADDATDNDDNGSQVGTDGAVSSPVFNLSYGAEPDAGVDGNDTDTDYTKDFGFFSPPTVAVITLVQAFEEGGTTIVEWQTASERNTAGFYLERWNVELGSYEAVNAELVPAVVGAEVGGVYQIPDTTIQSGDAVRYRIRELETDGAVRTYGPYDLVVDQLSEAFFETYRITTNGSNFRLATTRHAHAISQGDLVRYLASQDEQFNERNLRRSLVGNSVNVVVEAEGVYFVSVADIAAMFDITEWYTVHLLRTGQLEMRNQGARVTYVVSGDGQGLYFYGQAIDSVYTRENIYSLGWGHARNSGRRNSGRVDPVSGGNFIDVARVEEDVIYQPSQFNDPDVDHWGWERLAAFSDAGDSEDFAVPTPGVDAGGDVANVQVEVVGSTASGVANEHHIVVHVNGNNAGEFRFTGMTQKTWSADVPVSWLTDGDTVVRVEAVKDPGVWYSYVDVDSIEIAYPRRFVAHGDRLVFRSEGRDAISVDGFSSPDVLVLDVTDPNNPVEMVRPTVDDANGAYRVSFVPPRGAERFVAIARTAIDAVADLRPRTAFDLVSTDIRANYVVITTAGLAPSAQELADYRATQGYETLVVVLEDIYAQFSNDIATPHAIHDFLRFAYENWELPPEMVVLCGDGTYDYRDLQGRGDNLVPPLLVNTPYGLFGSDSAYGEVTGDDVPEIAVGRLPVVTAAEITALVQKISTYESAAAGPWATAAAFVADNPDAAGNFDTDNRNLGDLVSGQLSVHLIDHTSGYNPNPTKTEIKAAFASGIGLLNYVGHGGPERFANEGILTKADVAGLTNGQDAPLVLAMTCNVGRFTLPGFNCLMEELVLKAEGGAIATWAPTGLSQHSYALALNRSFLRVRYANGENVLGRAVLEASRQFREEVGDDVFGMLHIYNIIGDPAIRLK